MSASGDTSSLASRIAVLAARGEVAAPEGTLARRVARAKVGGAPLSQVIVPDRR